MTHEANQLEIESLEGTFAICKVKDYSLINLEAPFCFACKTDQERSLVCAESDAPSNATHIDGSWRAFRMRGQLDFALTGILAGIADVLTDASIGIFAVSTYDTDYILVKADQFKRAAEALERAGYKII